ncbi:MAG: hypothetical protein ABL994_14235 [Verrucomicrobiales bacterium]
MNSEPSDLLTRFRASMVMNHEKWHEGIGYDISLFNEATPAEFEAIESLLVSRGVSDWRDAEALASLDTERSREILKRAFESGSNEIRFLISRFAPDLAATDERADALITILRNAPLFGALSGALDEIVDFHPPSIIEALFDGLKEREGDVAVHFAAMLFHLHGKSEEPFDLRHRDFFLRFNTSVSEERDKAIQELLELIQTR